jgi:hypothetical protein
MSESRSSAGGGISFAGLLTIVFIVLKLCHVIAWSWLWVLAPMWIGVALFGGFALLAMVFVGVVALFARR